VLLGIVSDIHCNYEGLKTALDRMGAVDELLCSGDAIYQYRFNNEVIELLREREARYILGNHELTFLGPGGVRAQAAPFIRPENLEYVKAQPVRLEVRVNGRKLLMVHGSPFEPSNEYLFPGTRGLQRLAGIDADYIVLGHTHYAMAEPVGRALVVNSGSAGEGRDHRNDRDLSYAVLDTASGEVRFDYYPDPRFPAVAT
jgi:putative phosphoesterase